MSLQRLVPKSSFASACPIQSSQLSSVRYRKLAATTRSEGSRVLYFFPRGRNAQQLLGHKLGGAGRLVPSSDSSKVCDHMPVHVRRLGAFRSLQNVGSMLFVTTLSTVSFVAVVRAGPRIYSVLHIGSCMACRSRHAPSLKILECGNHTTSGRRNLSD